MRRLLLNALPNLNYNSDERAVNVLEERQLKVKDDILLRK